MAYPRPPPPPKTPELRRSEMVALHSVSKHRVVELAMLRRLEKLGLVEQKSGVWTTTQQGAILLMFGAAR
jgi:Mn-dependent DtxR family transcriptional regulator